jgi:hypothetical protein
VGRNFAEVVPLVVAAVAAEGPLGAAAAAAKGSRRLYEIGEGGTVKTAVVVSLAAGMVEGAGESPGVAVAWGSPEAEGAAGTAELGRRTVPAAAEMAAVVQLVVFVSADMPVAAGQVLAEEHTAAAVIGVAAAVEGGSLVGHYCRSAAEVQPLQMERLLGWTPEVVAAAAAAAAVVEAAVVAAAVQTLGMEVLALVMFRFYCCVFVKVLFLLFGRFFCLFCPNNIFFRQKVFVIVSLALRNTTVLRYASNVAKRKMISSKPFLCCFFFNRRGKNKKRFSLTHTMSTLFLHGNEPQSTRKGWVWPAM